MSAVDILDIAGTFVFAVAGAFRATRHRLDLLGVMVLAVATGVGGGMIRDLLLGATPVAAIQSELYLGVFVVSGLLALTIAWLTVSYQAIRAATSNPVEALHYE